MLLLRKIIYVSSELMTFVITYIFNYFIKLLPPIIRGLFHLLKSLWQRTMQWPHIPSTYLLLNDLDYAILFFIIIHGII